MVQLYFFFAQRENTVGKLNSGNSGLLLAEILMGFEERDICFYLFVKGLGNTP